MAVDRGMIAFVLTCLAWASSGRRIAVKDALPVKANSVRRSHRKSKAIVDHVGLRLGMRVLCDPDVDFLILRGGALREDSGDLYLRLNVSRDADDAEIKRAFHKAAVRWHPDKNPDNQEHAEKMFKNVKEAYDVLSDPQKRAAYDKYGNRGEGGGRENATAGSDFSSMFGGVSHENVEDLFRSFFGKEEGAGGFPGFGGRGRFGGGNFPFGGGSAASSGSFPMYGARPRQQADHYVIPRDTKVVIRDLVSGFRHNGEIGRVAGFDEARRRYQVKLLTDGSTISVKPHNIVQACVIEVVGLRSDPELNGKVGDVVSYQTQGGRYVVQLYQPVKRIELSRENCLLMRGSRVVLEDITSKKYKSLNGEMAQILSVDRAKARYLVQCRSGEKITVRYDKVVC